MPIHSKDAKPFLESGKIEQATAAPGEKREGIYAFKGVDRCPVALRHGDESGRCQLETGHDGRHKVHWEWSTE